MDFPTNLDESLSDLFSRIIDEFYEKYDYLYPFIISGITFIESNKIIFGVIISILILVTVQRKNYIDIVYNIEKNSTLKQLESKYAIKTYIHLVEDTNTFFIIGFPDKEIKYIKVYEFDKYPKILFKNRLKYKLIEKNRTKIYPNEYLLIQTIESEGIPMYKIKARVDGQIAEFDFSYNGLYGTRNKDKIKVKQGIINLIIKYFS